MGSDAERQGSAGRRLHTGAATATGASRERNEDAHLLQPADGLFVVCDGMGGTPGGDTASRIAALTIAEEWRRRGVAVLGDHRRRHYESDADRLVAAVRQSNKVIHESRQPEPGGMGTTVVCVSVRGGRASVVHVGDSRAYLWRDQRVERLTEDHTLWEALASEGLEGAWDKPQEDPRDILLRVVGGEPEVQVDVSEIAVRTGDYFVLCTDGLTRVVPDTTLAASIARLRNPQRICDHLVHTAMRDGAADDVTVAIVELVKTGS